MRKELIINVLNKKNIEINKDILIKMRKRAIVEGKKLKGEIDNFTEKYTSEIIDFNKIKM